MQRSILAGLGANPISNPPEVPRSRKWKVWVLLLAGLAFAAWLLRERWMGTGFDWSALARSFLDLDWRWMTVAIILALLTYIGRALRWRVMLRPLRPNAGLWSLVSATMIGFSAVTLLGRPGEFVRPYLISRKQAVPLSSQLAAWFLERLWDMLALVLIFGYALMHIGESRATLGPRFEAVLETGGYIIAAIGLACLVVLVGLNRFSSAMRSRLVEALAFLPERHHRRMDQIITAFLDGAASTKSPGSVILLLSYTVAEWAVIVLSIACVFRAFPATAGFGLPDVLTLTGFLAFGSLVQIPGIGGGVQIVSIIVLNELFRVPLAPATGIAIMIWIISWIVVVPVGLALAFHEGLNWRQLKALEQEAIKGAEAAESGGESGQTPAPEVEDPA